MQNDSVSYNISSDFLRFLCDEFPGFNFDSSSLFIIAAHPDDEVIGAGAQLPRLKHAAFLHVTDGAPENMREAENYGFSSREDYARARRAELCDALSIAGINFSSCIDMGLPDQKSSFYMADLARNLSETFMQINPGFILTHPYEGGHPDHDTTAFAVHAACRILESKGITPPFIFEFSSYHSRDNGALAAYEFLPDPSCKNSITHLTEEKRRMKQKMFDCFKTQANVLKGFPLEIECFRSAPRYDFTKPPHEGKLYYEYFDWGMNGLTWRKLAEEALDKLELSK